MSSTERLRQVFQKILHSNLESLEPEIEALLHHTLRRGSLEHNDLLRGKVREAMDLLLDRGEDACRGLLENLSRNHHLFPGILQILKDGGMDEARLKNVAEDLGLRRFLHHKLKLSDVQSFLCEEPSCPSMQNIPLRFLRHVMALNIREAFESFPTTSEQDDSDNVSRSIHPLDVLCCLLHCLDNFLRQEMIRRMSMCRVPVPLLLPPGEDAHSTFLLWAMRGITRNEDSVVNMALPFFSFVSLGDYRYSPIANIITQVLTTDQHALEEEFVHRVTGWDDLPRCISDGLVEISWYFPADHENPTLSEKPFAMMTLHGDVLSNSRQYQFLSAVSSRVFVLMNNVTCEQWDLFLRSMNNHTTYDFIFLDQIEDGTDQFCRHLLSHCRSVGNVLEQSDEMFNEKLQFILIESIQRSPPQMTLSEMSVVAMKHNFYCDENQPGCERGRLHALDFTKDQSHVLKSNEDYGNKMQQLQMFLQEWCHLRNQGELHTTGHKSIDVDDIQAAHGLFYISDMTNIQFIFTHLQPEEQKYFLKWIQYLHLPSSEMRHENMFSKIGEIYEACSTAETARVCGSVPSGTADLLLQGFPLEIINGDTSRIHERWMKEVLSELNTKTRGKCRIRVISVLGVQGTGKSTLMNTMFGLQFPVGHRQCTRGALMSLIKVDEKDLGCDFLVVIDCEGFRALDNAPLEENYEHDNELATLILGLSDFVILNMDLGSTSDMKNILQIAIHALFEMRGNGQKPQCLLVYQTMERTCSEEHLMMEDTRTPRPAAQTDEGTKFLPDNDTIECNILEDTWIIPFFDLNTSHYSEKVVELKKQLLQMIKSQPRLHKVRDMQSFAGDIHHLRKSVRHNNYIFRFKNISERSSHGKIYERFLELKYRMYREMHEWWVQTSAKATIDTNGFIQDALRMLNEKTRRMEKSLQGYITDSSQDSNSNMARKFKDEFMVYIQSLKSDLESHYTNKCLQMKVLKCGLPGAITTDFIENEWDLEKMPSDLERYWNDSVAKYQSTMKNHDVEEEFLQLLRQDMMTKGGAVTQLICDIDSLSNYAHTAPTLGAEDVNRSWFVEKCNHVENCRDCYNTRNNSARFVLEKSSKYVQNMTESNRAYDLVYGMDLLKMVDDVICQDPMPYTVLFQLNLKLQILAQSAPHFQKMHDDFLQEWRAQCAVEQQKVRVINHLGSVRQDKILIKQYFQDYLQPVVIKKVKKMFREKLNNHYTGYICALVKRRQKPLQGSPTSKCLHHTPVDDALENICSRFTDEREIQLLLTDLISSVVQDIRERLNRQDILESGDIGALVAAVWSDEGGSSVEDNVTSLPLHVTVANVFHCAYYLDFCLEELEKLFQEKLIFQIMMEHYMECPARPMENHWRLGGRFTNPAL